MSDFYENELSKSVKRGNRVKGPGITDKICTYERKQLFEKTGLQG